MSYGPTEMVDLGGERLSIVIPKNRQINDKIRSALILELALIIP